MSQSVVLFGGSFDPLHLGHLALAQLAYETLDVSQVIFIPTSQNPLKGSGYASAVDRIAMVEEVLIDIPHFSVWPGEVDRKGRSYTFNTLEQITQEFALQKPYFLMGSDSVASFHQWYKAKELLSLMTPAIVQRPGIPCVFDASLGEVEVVEIPSPHWGISSSMIREYLAHGLSGTYLLPPSVIRYIEQHKLYGRRV